MKPNRLTICGINSYVTPQTIDFKKLSEGNLFGIFGATGSGKSTILDAMVIALYGTSDRDNLSNIINVNVKDAYIKFVFEIERNHEQSVVEVVRNFRLRPSGLTSGATLTNLTTNQVLADSTDKVNEVLENMLGVSKREFLKCVALPQNEFDKFLLDTPAERKKSVAKLFNLEHFGEDLNRKVKSRLDVLTAKDVAITEQLKTFEGINHNTQQELQNQITELEKYVLSAEIEVKAIQQLISELDVKYNISKNLIVAKQELFDIKSLDDVYLSVKNSLENYSKNKNYLEKLNLVRTKLIELDAVNNKHQIANFEVKTNKEKLEKLEKELTELKDKQRLLDAEYDMFKLALEKRKVLNSTIDEMNEKLKQLKDEHSKNLDALLIVTERESKVSKNLAQVNKDITETQNKLKENENLLNKIHQVLLLSESEGFIDKLSDLKFGINQTNLDEVEDYKVHKDILSLVAKINKYINSYKLNLKKRDELIDALDISVDNLSEANIKLINTQNEILADLATLDKKHDSLYASKIAYSLDIANINSDIDKLKQAILDINKFIKDSEVQIQQFNDVKDCSDEINEVILKIEDTENKIFEVNNLITNNNSNIKAYEVEQKYLLQEIETCKSQIPDGFDVAEIESEINEENFEEYSAKLAEYEKQKNYYETLIDSLTKELDGEPVDINLVEEKRAVLETTTETLNDARINLGILKANYENNVKMLIRQNELENEQHAIHTDLKLTQKLASYIAKNALVDFVSEEYLYLISEYANKFVYSLSSGKYMLKYSTKNLGEFVAVDNFNGGATRSIKTLSGGERFIFSLGLALGVSQSIAVNNNKAFNFFFIDEGFGNLSDDYIDDVLNCFDSLIKLDFTVGFITHVEKMQEYIANKVVVSKDNNEDGTKIEQY